MTGTTVVVARDIREDMGTIESIVEWGCSKTITDIAGERQYD